MATSDTYVIAYELSWNPEQRIGSVQLKYSNEEEAKFEVSSAADLGGWAALLKDGPLYLFSDGSLHSGRGIV